MNFKDYLVEGELRFGKHGGKDIAQVPTGYLVWVMQNVGVGRNLSSEERQEIEEFLASQNINWRNFQLNQAQGGQQAQRPQAPQRPQAQVQRPAAGYGRLDISDRPGGGGENDPEIPGEPERNTPPPQTKSSDFWWYVQAVKNFRDFSQGQDLAIKGPLSSGAWAFRVLGEDPANAKAGVIKANEVTGLIKAYRKDGTALKSTELNNPTLEDLKRQLGGETGGQAPQQEPQQAQPEEEQQDEKTQKWSQRPAAEACRLPPEHVNEYVEKIQSRFNQTHDHFMIDALAGTGKTTSLKHLASFIKPGEKWLYLVFNKKNQTESVTEFPKGVAVMTTHSFLGKILAQNGKGVGGKTLLPPRNAKWKRINRVLDKLVPLTWPTGPNSRLNYTNKKTGQPQSPFNYKAKNVVLKLGNLAKNTAHDPNDPQIKQQLMQLIDNNAIDTDVSTERTVQDRDYTQDILDTTIKLMKTTIAGALPKDLGIDELANVRDQDDTLWYSALNADHMRWDRPTKYDVILMDEVQDFNKCQLIMAKKLRETGARVIGVGDPHQAMYLFRGSDAKAFEELRNIIGGDQPGESLSLPLNFRSDGNLLDWVNRNTLMAELPENQRLRYPDNKKGKGEVYATGGTHPPVGYRDFMDQVQREWSQAPETTVKDENGQEKRTKKFQQDTSMICRSNSPLAHAALQLLKSGIDFEIIGKDMSKDLTDHIKKVTWNNPKNTEIDDLPNKLGAFLEETQNKWGHKIAKKDELKEMEEFTETLNSVLEYLSEKDYKESPESRSLETAEDFIKWIEMKMGGRNPDNEEDMAKFKAKDPKTFVTLTTAHKCKGLQWDRVFLMKPKAYDPEHPKNKTEEQKEQEKNALYVAATRGKKTLYVSSDEEP